MRERYDEAPRGDGYFHVGNPLLDPERSTSFELGLKGNDGDFTYQLADFHTRIDVFIVGRVTGPNATTGLPIKRTENPEQVVILDLYSIVSKAAGAFMGDGS